MLLATYRHGKIIKNFVKLKEDNSEGQNKAMVCYRAERQVVDLSRKKQVFWSRPESGRLCSTHDTPAGCSMAQDARGQGEHPRWVACENCGRARRVRGI